MQINNLKIRYNRIYEKYDVITPDGRVLEQFDKIKNAKKFAKETEDFIKVKV